ncbi:Peroxiredoxin-like 2C [Fulvia fulva]|uniref:Peroxiredoxin-like 2C n=1 Tax=Passalora fulva TaxID=5499 RepID=A0A9Q8L812_PASFU|nr:Peroxiredoxin-like 2C [Fulvia fulva]KAK4634511.1 Peroxiredoxin-like 2C [Fulvia fulva]KAK4638540.1 Peroxiredoxin-like 2C [Fulvia fulva]UJO12605.1 Peroxiredoxin-like 2C [Fulvia fulva]WPV09877.1 Peroxiredoxin-like 2C [Fulvia fulva]WPV23475.1 Peroxiredoxin-like 2C [Fulvia fulva]
MGAINGNVNASEKAWARQHPEPKLLEEAGEFKIKDENGKDIPLQSLYTDKDPNERQLVIFIRHFLCGSCEEYVRALGKDLPPSTLSSARVTLTLIGCGDPKCIPDYKKRTNCPCEIYADPSRQIYQKLGMVSNLRKSAQKPQYLTKGFGSIIFSSFVNALKSPSDALGAGPPSQNGGEWLFKAGSLQWCHRMEDTTGHADTSELKEVLGIE